MTPDLTCMGKVIGGGLPVGAFGGKKEIMSMVSPAGGCSDLRALRFNCSLWVPLVTKKKPSVYPASGCGCQSGVCARVHFKSQPAGCPFPEIF